MNKIITDKNEKDRTLSVRENAHKKKFFSIGRTNKRGWG